nr:NAC domain-containing protein 82-like [Tanacetum cinerariifolium]
MTSGGGVVASVVTKPQVNIYDYSPWDLRDKSALKNEDLECGSRYNRATEIGFWKATEKDRTVTYKGRTVATIKTLVFHIGNSGKGERTEWVMHEYRLEDEQLSNAGVVQDTYVLVKLFEKAGSGLKNAAMEMMTLEPESSIVTLSANERREEVPVDDGDMMSLEDIAFCLGVSE